MGRRMMCGQIEGVEVGTDYPVEPCGRNGEDGLHVSRDYPGCIDLMITDVVMPKMSGPALAANLAAERPGMKVLFVSGYAENTVLRHGSIDVTARFLAKPFDLTSLARKVRQVLEEPLARATSA